MPMNASADILANLNPPQREAVSTLSGPMLILAGAGSGKTRVVTRRIANLIAHGTRPWEVLAITFTNKAAGEMRRRVEELAGGSGVWLSTFHSFCARLLRREAPVLELSPNFTIFDEDDAQKVLKDIATELRLEDKRYSPGNLRALIGGLKAKGLRAADLDAPTFHERIVQQIYERYEQALRRNQALDFDDLLLRAVELLRDHEDVREKYRRRFKQVLVDEYQDTNGCQYQLVKLLGEGHRNVCVTGDPDQSIYSWRGADVRNILSFERDFPEAKVVRLEQNYRSTRRVLALASAVIKHNTERKDKELWTENDEGEKPLLRIVGDQELEAYEVVSEAERLVANGARYGEIAIFYRTNAQSRPFEQALIRSAIPYQLIGGTPFYERREVKDALAYLRLLVNPNDDVSFARIVNVPKRGIGNSTLDLIAKKAGEFACSMLATLDRTAWMERELKPRARKELFAFARMMDAWRGLPRQPVAPLVERVLKDSGLLKALEEAGEEERVQNLEQFLNAAANYDNENATLLGEGDLPAEPGAFDEDALAAVTPDLPGFLENTALMTPTDERKDDTDVVTLMTLHMAKGLEYPYVFIAGLEEGLLPMVRSTQADMAGGEDPNSELERAVEEERRLFYVGATRAMKRLYLTRARHRMRFGKTDLAVPSRFLDEIPEAGLDVDDKTSGDFGQGFGFSGLGRQGAAFRHGGFEDFGRELDEFVAASRKKKQGKSLAAYASEARKRGSGFDDEFSQLNESGLEVGDRVHHASFGNGTVEGFSGSGLSAKVKVHFTDAGPKLLLLNLAKLRKV